MPLFITNLEIDQGATFRRSFIVAAAGSPIDLTGYKARAQIRLLPSSTTVLVDMTTENGVLSIEPLAGKISIYLPASQTKALTFTETGAFYDLEIYQVSNPEEVTRVLGGTVILNPEVTRE